METGTEMTMDMGMEMEMAMGVETARAMAMVTDIRVLSGTAQYPFKIQDSSQ